MKRHQSSAERILVLGLAISFAAAISCEDPTFPVVVETPVIDRDTTTIRLGGTVDITDGIRKFKNVHVYGTLTYHTEFFDDLARASERTSAGRIGVFLNPQLQFKRVDDYQGVSQSWHAGGKSYDILPLQENGTAMTHKKYQLWGIPNIAFVNIEFLIQRSGVLVHNIWVSYEYPD
jgi:hypothetical protein